MYCSSLCHSDAKRYANPSGLGSGRYALRVIKVRGQAKAKPRLWYAGACKGCGASFVTDQPHQGCCSKRCNQRRHKKASKRMRRKHIQAAPERIHIYEIAERDGWRCHICERKVTRETWSLDHLVPISAGGPHTHDNVAIAHHRCNALRGAHGPAQLRLTA